MRRGPAGTFAYVPVFLSTYNFFFSLSFIFFPLREGKVETRSLRRTCAAAAPRDYTSIFDTAGMRERSPRVS